MSDKTAKTESRVAIIVAFVAIFISIYEGYEIRKHNRLSIRPFIDSSPFSSNHDYFDFKLKNAGLGPAIIEEFKIYANGIEVRNWNEAIDTLNLSKYRYMTNLSKGTIIASEETVKLIAFDTVFRPFNIRIKLKYRSAYDEEFEMDERF